METIKTSLICTVFNEEKTIGALLESIGDQSVMPDEVIMVDGGSSDRTAAELKVQSKKLKVPFKILIKPGNRAVGRNEAIRNAEGQIILCCDAGCKLDKNWIKEILLSFKKDTDVVAGYYKGISSNSFQESLIPYVLVMEDKVNPKTFLPATRSMAFTKKIWEEVGGFGEQFSFNEDFVFANTLKKKNAGIVFNKNAIVNWFPPNSFLSSFKMFFKFAYGDAQAGIFRPKVFFIFLRYLIGILLLKISFTVLMFVLLYILWAIKKNYAYVKKKEAFFYLPLFQFTSDIAVISGTLLGLFRKVF